MRLSFVTTPTAYEMARPPPGWPLPAYVIPFIGAPVAVNRITLVTGIVTTVLTAILFPHLVLKRGYLLLRQVVLPYVLQNVPPKPVLHALPTAISQHSLCLHVLPQLIPPHHLGVGSVVVDVEEDCLVF